ncbi:MAG: DNA replication/repair protein RecF [Gemmatimonadales bacterium]
MARGFRNLTDLDLVLPAAGAVFLGPNGHGKTNLLELLSYPVLFRSLRGARDSEVVRHGETGFQLTLSLAGNGSGSVRELAAGFRSATRKKAVGVDGAEATRLGDAIGHWLAVAFLPGDLALVQGGAAVRRQYLDRLLALADRQHFRALVRYRQALSQRNAALRSGRRRVAEAFDSELGGAGARLVRRRLEWVEEQANRFSAGCSALGEPARMTMRYCGSERLADEEAWPGALRDAAARDDGLGQTTIGPHRDELELRLDGRPLRQVGSTGQHRTVAIALRLRERDTLAEARGDAPALLLDDVFAELDRERQERLAELLEPERSGGPQVFITSPRADELPAGFHLPVMTVESGTVGGVEVAS